MTNESNHENQGDHENHADYERQDVSVAGILYFLVGLAIFLLISQLVVSALYSILEKRSQAEQKPISPLIVNAPVDTRKLPMDYREYLKQSFPAPQLETDERTQLNGIIMAQEEKLNTYDYIDKQAGTVRIPIERAMELIAQRGLPVRDGAPSASTAMASAATNIPAGVPTAAKAAAKPKGKKK